jgi:hypothetical protein
LCTKTFPKIHIWRKKRNQFNQQQMNVIMAIDLMSESICDCANMSDIYKNVIKRQSR